MNTIFKVFWYDSTREMNPKSTNCEADALTTTPPRRSSVGIKVAQYDATFDFVNIPIDARQKKDVAEAFITLVPLIGKLKLIFKLHTSSFYSTLLQYAK